MVSLMVACACGLILLDENREKKMEKNRAPAIGGSLRPWVHGLFTGFYPSGSWQAQVISGPLASWISVVIGIVHHCPALRRVVVLAV